MIVNSLRKASIAAAFFCGGAIWAQSHLVEGRILDETDNSPVAGAKVTVGGKEATTDVSGYYSIPLEAGTNYTMVITGPNYRRKEISDLAISATENTHLDVLVAKAPAAGGDNQIDGVVIRSSARRETVASTIAQQKNSAVVAQVVGVEAIKRSPDRNTGEVLKRVSGVSLFEGKYIVVRGLSDRYNQAMLNGVQLSSTEPDKKTFSFDLFPANVIETLVINKTFIPEYTGEWAGALIQVNTKDIPTKSFVNAQVGFSYNTNTISKEFYMQQKGNTDWLGFDDGSRALPHNMPTKNQFGLLSDLQKTVLGTQYASNFGYKQVDFPESVSLQLDAGGKTKLFGKDLGVIGVFNYANNFRRQTSTNRFFTINGTQADVNFDYDTERYNNDISLGGMLNFSYRLNGNNSISLKNLVTHMSTNHVSLRTGKDFELDPINGTNIKATEIGFKETTFYNSTLSGNHKFDGFTVNWYGSFGILDQYIPKLQRLQYNQQANGSWLALISSGSSQKSGSFFNSSLNDYLYNAGGDLAKTFDIGGQKQTVKGGYLFQVKDRLYNARPFFVSLDSFNAAILSQPEGSIYNLGNFAINPGENKLHFDELTGNQFRYLANTILNAGYLQFDNNFSSWLRAVWGLRVESFDQLIGSVKQWDPRHVNSKVIDYLPAVNLTAKINNQMNLRLAGSQTVVRPEFRELSPMAYYDFDLGATIIGNQELKRTKVTNADIRYEYYPKAGEIISVAGFYKNFQNPIELYFNQTGAGTSNTFNFLNAEKATAYGVELELRKKLDFMSLDNFTFGGNVALISNQVKDNVTGINRPMQGQSPYTINATLQYDNAESGWNSTVLFNMIGRRILYVGNDQVPPVWENPRPLLDFQLAKRIWDKKAEFKLNISDILNRYAQFYHDVNDNKKLDDADAVAIQRRLGTNISLTFAYSF